ncbi:MAG: hypothetical protein L0Y50_02690 [Beijerinckiaceae bacterium]|nr:hypothetical protein [Beijerinckiaceae bacterium]MCI0735174.1 hypothetical protein [Beijerinckiaceae bacterium]
MNLTGLVERTEFWQRFRRSMMTLWQPLILLAVVPTIITLAAELPFVVNFILVIAPLFAVAAYLAYSRFGVRGLVSVATIFLLGVFLKLWNLLSSTINATAPTKITGPIDQNVTAYPHGVSLVILIAMLIFFASGGYFISRVLGGEHMTRTMTVIFVIILVGFAFSGLRLG